MSSTKLPLLLFFFGAALAPAQTIPTGTFQHIIIVVQENRTPDNLFGSFPNQQLNCNRMEDPFESGVDIVNGGPANGKGIQCNIPQPMNVGQDMPHSFLTGWKPQYDNGQMDGFCQVISNGKCLQYSYVQGSDVQPYFAIATNYGFANYFFQTNEGPSFPAHQFLFTGTSAPVAPPSLYFAAENGGDSYHSGCPDTTNKAEWIDPAAMELLGSYECYTHDSLVTNANGDKGVSWRYYTPTQFAIWDAPRAIPEVCYGENDLNKQGQPCSGTEWSHIVIPNTRGYDGAPILDDIASCSLQKISWVIPDKIWSDHPAQDNHNPPLGPSWVGDIVNAIGNSWTNSNHKCDYWGNNSNDTTAIFVVWDDWGGWYDHVVPPEVYRGTDTPVPTCPTNVQPNGWGCGYVYGFRVPFLVVSEYTKAGYVSGACTGNCPNKTFPYVHDFGSILAFTEYNFGMQPIAQPYYADYNALDWDALHSVAPLSDFFSLGNQRNFTNIPTVYPPDFYKDYYLNNPTYSPTGPDGTDSD